MTTEPLSYGVYYAVYLLEFALFLFLLFRGHWKRQTGVFVYVASLLLIDGMGRSYVLHRYGLASREYWYFFWLTDVLLALAAFLLVCSFFRRACAQEERMWRFLRLLLVFVFILVFGISSFSLSRNFSTLVTRFVVEFQQNLYFTCLVLNTLLYVLMQQIHSTDDELGLLVCGVGIQFAGPAAGLALVRLTLGEAYSESLLKIILQLCTLGMLLIWFHAFARVPKVAPLREGLEHVPALAAASARKV